MKVWSVVFLVAVFALMSISLKAQTRTERKIERMEKHLESLGERVDILEDANIQGVKIYKVDKECLQMLLGDENSFVSVKHTLEFIEECRIGISAPIRSVCDIVSRRQDAECFSIATKKQGLLSKSNKIELLNACEIQAYDCG